MKKIQSLETTGGKFYSYIQNIKYYPPLKLFLWDTCSTHKIVLKKNSQGQIILLFTEEKGFLQNKSLS